MTIATIVLCNKCPATHQQTAIGSYSIGHGSADLTWALLRGSVSGSRSTHNRLSPVGWAVVLPSDLYSGTPVNV